MLTGKRVCVGESAERYEMSGERENVCYVMRTMRRNPYARRGGEMRSWIWRRGAGKPAGEARESR